MKVTEQNRLEQIKFLRTFAQDFDHFHQMYLKAFPMLVKYNKIGIPNKMTPIDWDRVTWALGEYYQSVRFLYKIALLTDAGIIDKELLYMFYYDEITDDLTQKLKTLIRWCGTGLDSAANYSSYDIARTATTLIDLLEKLNTVHQEHGADLDIEGQFGFIERFKDTTKDFFLIQENLTYVLRIMCTIWWQYRKKGDREASTTITRDKINGSRVNNPLKSATQSSLTN